MTRRTGPALVLGVVAAVTSSTSGPFGKLLLEADWSVGAVATVRTGVAALALLPLALWTARRRDVSFRGSMPSVVALGVVGTAGTMVCYFNAVARMPVGVAMMVMYTAPVLVLLVAWLRDGDRPALRTIVGAGFCVAGLVAVVGARGVAPPDPVGLLWAAGAAGCVATYFLTSDRASANIPPTVLGCVALLIATATTFGLGVVGALPSRFGEAVVQLDGTELPALVPLLLVALVSTVFTYVASMAAVRALGARLMSFVGLTELIAALGTAWLLLDEVPRPSQLVGGALIVMGVLLIREPSQLPTSALNTIGRGSVTSRTRSSS